MLAQPLHSVIIPTCNRANNLSAALTSISALNGVSEIEIIVVDNGSTDNTKKICDSFNSIIPKLIYVYDDMPGLLTGRHKGASLAKANIISFIDDDVELNQEWSVGIQKAFEENEEVHLLTGPCLPKYETTPPQWLQYFWNIYPEGKDCPWLSLADRGNKIVEIDSLHVWGLNFSIRKNSFYKLDGFHPDNIPAEFQQFQGDGETGLAKKAKENNYKALYLPEAMLHHIISKERMTIAYFEKRFYYQGVCDSFTQLRTQNGLYIQESYERVTGSILTRFAKKISGMLKPVANNNPKSISEKDNIMQNLKNKYNEGFSFHQQAFQRDAVVREWVLKKNYWNYQLPIHDRKIFT